MKKELAGVVLGAILAVAAVQIVLVVLRTPEPPVLMAAKEMSSPDQRGAVTEETAVQSSFPPLQLVILPLALLMGIMVYTISKRRVE